MRLVARSLALPFVAAALFGPPHLTVTAVAPQPATPGAPAFTVAIEHHHEDVAVTARAEGVQRGVPVTRALTLVRRDSTHYTVARQWDAGTPWVLVLAVEQGEGGRHGVAEAVVSIDARGAVQGITYTTPGFVDGTKEPRRVTRREVQAALAKLGVSTAG
ncbi:MAG: hypothetical protein LCH84_02430 [Gemmatimonadetes bacterium]|nr:hypothetical protein [Gemmatimonadota bacterium]